MLIWWINTNQTEVNLHIQKNLKLILYRESNIMVKASNLTKRNEIFIFIF